MASSLETIHGIYAAFARGDMETVLGAFAPNIEWTEATGFPYGGTFHGPQAVLDNVFMKLGTEWEAWTAEPHDFVADGDTVIALGDYGGTFKATGKRVDVPFVHEWHLKDGKVARFRQHTDTLIVNQALS